MRKRVQSGTVSVSRDPLSKQRKQTVRHEWSKNCSRFVERLVHAKRVSRLSFSAIAEIQASRGGPQNPLPNRPTTRKALGPATELVIGRMILASVEKPYPANVRALRFPVLSAIQPAK